MLIGWADAAPGAAWQWALASSEDLPPNIGNGALFSYERFDSITNYLISQGRFQNVGDLLERETTSWTPRSAIALATAWSKADLPAAARWINHLSPDPDPATIETAPNGGKSWPSPVKTTALEGLGRAIVEDIDTSVGLIKSLSPKDGFYVLQGVYRQLIEAGRILDAQKLLHRVYVQEGAQLNGTSGQIMVYFAAAKRQFGVETGFDAQEDLELLGKMYQDSSRLSSAEYYVAREASRNPTLAISAVVKYFPPEQQYPALTEIVRAWQARDKSLAENFLARNTILPESTARLLRGP